jgi:hypothetical protein
MSSRQQDEARQTQQSNASRCSEPVTHSHRCAREGRRGCCLFTQRSKQAWTIMPGRDRPGHGTTWQMPAARWWLLLLIVNCTQKKMRLQALLSQKPSVEILKLFLNSLRICLHRSPARKPGVKVVFHLSSFISLCPDKWLVPQGGDCKHVCPIR